MPTRLTRLAQYVLLAAVMAIFGRASAADGVTIGAGVSTLGASIESGFRSGSVGARLLGNYFSYTGNVTTDGIDYHGTGTLRSIGFAADWYPFSTSGFRLSAGLFVNGNQLTGEATPNTSITIGNVVYTPVQAGKLNVKVKYQNTVSPYFGIGYAFDLGSHILLTPQAGVTLLGDSKVTLTSTSIYVTQADLAKESASIANDANKLSVYPVVSLTLSYNL